MKNATKEKITYGIMVAALCVKVTRDYKQLDFPEINKNIKQRLTPALNVLKGNPTMYKMHIKNGSAVAEGNGTMIVDSRFEGRQAPPMWMDSRGDVRSAYPNYDWVE